jgi:diguanylate cyclase (GGDEF)-like protein
MPLMSAIAVRALRSDQDEGSLSFLAADGSRRAVSYIRIAGTNARLIASIDEDKVSAAVSRDIRTAYLQLAFVVLFVLLGALIAAEKLVIKPIEMLADMAKRLGEGDLSARAARNRLPAEFVPLARAFNAMAAQLSQRERELIASNDRLTVMASIDMLSGLANRRGFQSRLDFEWMRAQQYGSELALLMIDVDHFKLFNDNHGHQRGDECLRDIAAVIGRTAIRPTDLATRYGGEEFAIIMPDTDMAAAGVVAERLRHAVVEMRIALGEPTDDFCVTLSVGVATYVPGQEVVGPEWLIGQADQALYAAKHLGRNRVVSTDNMLLELAKARLTRANAGGPAQSRKARG